MAMQTMEIRQAIRPYSMAVAPHSSRQKLFKAAFIIVPPVMS
jgi:hypothetical protein